MTIAYERNDSNVFFSYALCAVPTPYEKSEGRRFSSNTYLENMDEIHFDVSYVDTVNRVGCFCIADMRECIRQTALTHIFADHVIDKMTFKDLKHSMVSQILEEYIIPRV